MKILQNGTNIAIEGLIDTVKVSEELHNVIKDVIQKNPHQTITVDFKDTFVITSSLIGSLLGLVQRDKANINLITRNNELYQLLDKLNLIKTFNVREK